MDRASPPVHRTGELGTADADSQFASQIAGVAMPKKRGRYLLVAAPEGHEPSPYLHLIVVP